MKELVEKKKLLDTKEAARYLGLAPETLVNWRCTKQYDLPYCKVGRLVRYRREDLDAFLERRMQGVPETETP